MKKLLPLLILALLCLAGTFSLAAGVSTLQTTIGAATTQVTTTNTYCRQAIFQNNAGHVMRVGDVNTSSSRGTQLLAGSPGGSMTVGPMPVGASIDISNYYVNGTQNDVLDVTCIQ